MFAPSKTDNVLFSIIIPTYNRASYIKTTINSILCQKYNNFEIIIIDDGSTDSTKEIVTSIADNRINYFYIENGERGRARNYGVKKSNGKYVTFLDSDDIFYPEHLQTAYNIISKENFIPLFHLKYHIIKGNAISKPIYPSNKESAEEQLLIGNYLSCHGMFMLKQVAIDNPFNENREMAGLEDWELWIRLSVNYKIEIYDYYTSALIDHQERSVVNVNSSKIIKKGLLLIQTVMVNDDIIQKYQHLFSKFKASNYIYIALHIALTKKNKRTSIQYIIKALLNNYQLLFNKRLYAVIKHLI